MSLADTKLASGLKPTVVSDVEVLLLPADGSDDAPARAVVLEGPAEAVLGEIYRRRTRNTNSGLDSKQDYWFRFSPLYSQPDPTLSLSPNP